MLKHTLIGKRGGTGVTGIYLNLRGLNHSMPMYYIKDLANPVDPKWSDQWTSISKHKLKPERDRLNEVHSKDQPRKRFVIGTMR